MKKIENITFKQFAENCEELKEQYNGLLTPFFNARMIRCWKTMIYSLKLLNWQKDRSWEVLNGDFEVDELKKMCN